MKLRLKNTVIIGFAFLSIMVLWQAYNWLVPLYLDGYLRGVFNGNEFLIGLVMGLDNLFAVFMIPLIGKISDRQKAQTGSRMKLITVGIMLAGAAFICLPLAKGNIFAMIAVLFVILVAMNIYRAPAVSLMPDITPKPLRSKANAVINIMGGIGTAIGYILLLAGGVLNVDSSFTVWGVVLVMFVCLAVLMYKVDERQFEADMNADLALYKKMGIDVNADDEMLSCSDGALGKKEKKSLILVLLSVFFYYMATNAVETFMSLYSDQVLHNTNAGLILFGVLAGGSFIFLYPSAVFAQKHGFRNAMLLGACLMAGSNIFIAFFYRFQLVAAACVFRYRRRYGVYDFKYVSAGRRLLQKGRVCKIYGFLLHCYDDCASGNSCFGRAVIFRLAVWHDESSYAVLGNIYGAFRSDVVFGAYGKEGDFAIIYKSNCFETSIKCKSPAQQFIARVVFSICIK